MVHYKCFPSDIWKAAINLDRSWQWWCPSRELPLWEPSDNFLLADLNHEIGKVNKEVLSEHGHLKKLILIHTWSYFQIIAQTLGSSLFSLFWTTPKQPCWSMGQSTILKSLASAPEGHKHITVKHISAPHVSDGMMHQPASMRMEGDKGTLAGYGQCWEWRGEYEKGGWWAMHGRPGPSSGSDTCAELENSGLLRSALPL